MDEDEALKAYQEALKDGTPKHKRVPLSKRARFEVFKRDGFVCQYCGAHPPEVVLECDHIIPVAEGGTNDEGNLVTACADCNRGKSDISLSSVPRSLDDRRADMEEREAQIAGYEDVMRQRRQRIEDYADEVLLSFCDLYSRDGIPKTDYTSVKRFVERLGLDVCLWAVTRAHQQYPRAYGKAFKYFCGICWRKIKEQGPADQ